MSIIVEDGTGVAGAVSYMTVVEADAYHSARGMSLWFDLTEPNKEQALVRATDFMLQRYRLRWKGYRYTQAQRLDWPRAGVVTEGAHSAGYGLFQVPYNSVPEEVKSACAELALRASIGTLSEDISPRILQETVGPITVKYDKDSSQYVSYPQVDGFLKPLLDARNGPMMKLTRC